MLRINRLARFNVPRQLITRNLSKRLDPPHILDPGKVRTWREPEPPIEKMLGFCMTSGGCIGGGYGFMECVNGYRYERDLSYLVFSPVIIGFWAGIGAVAGITAPVWVSVYLVSFLLE